MAKTLAERLRDCAQGVSLGADGTGWSPDPALLEEAADKIVSLHAELQQARDAAKAERARCALRVALHSQYPIETDYDRGYDKARKDAAETLWNMSTYVSTYAPDRPSTTRRRQIVKSTEPFGCRSWRGTAVTGCMCR